MKKLSAILLTAILAATSVYGVSAATTDCIQPETQPTSIVQESTTENAEEKVVVGSTVSIEVTGDLDINFKDITKEFYESDECPVKAYRVNLIWVNDELGYTTDDDSATPLTYEEFMEYLAETRC